MRDAGLLGSALARPGNRVAYGTPDDAELAAAYAFGVARNHPFVDGNKRTAFVLALVFLLDNGYRLTADDASAYPAMIGLSDGTLSEEAFAEWTRQHLAPASSID